MVFRRKFYSHHAFLLRKNPRRSPVPPYSEKERKLLEGEKYCRHAVPNMRRRRAEQPQTYSQCGWFPMRHSLAGPLWDL